MSAEGGPGQHRHPRLVEERLLQGYLVPAGRLDVGEDVEGPGGPVAADPGDGVEPVDDDVAPLGELRHHGRHRSVGGGPLEGLDRRPLGEGGSAGRRVDHQRVHPLRQPDRHGPEPQPPAAHGQALESPSIRTHLSAIPSME